eukprot:6652023-Ditylum_brightwellii.AAC.1
MTLLKALNTIGSQQSKSTESTEQAVKQLMDYCATHLDATIQYYASGMILQVHSNAAYMNETNAHSTAGGHFLLGNKIHPSKPIFLNGAVHILCTILKLVAASAVKAELGALFLNACKAKPM